ncbi:hypothetical protein LXL04_023030 [Taraxacum kok-saghyz]
MSLAFIIYIKSLLIETSSISKGGQVSDSSPSWCYAPFEPDGILSSLTASVACIIGSSIWSYFDRITGIPLNKALYTISYLMVTSAASGLIFCALYLLVDVYKWRRKAFVFEWMGKHSLSYFVLVTSNLVVIMLQGFYWKSPHNNIVYWIVSHVVQNIINNLAPNPELSAILKSMNIQMPSTSTSSTSTVNQRSSSESDQMQVTLKFKIFEHLMA